MGSWGTCVGWALRPVLTVLSSGVGGGVCQLTGRSWGRAGKVFRREGGGVGGRRQVFRQGGVGGLLRCNFR